MKGTARRRALPIAPHRFAVELRDRSWLCAPVYEVLRRRGAALVIHDAIARHPRRLTADWTYLHLHGRSYRGNYSKQQLGTEPGGRTARVVTARLVDR